MLLGVLAPQGCAAHMASSDGEGLHLYARDWRNCLAPVTGVKG